MRPTCHPRASLHHHQNHLPQTVQHVRHPASYPLLLDCCWRRHLLLLLLDCRWPSRLRCCCLLLLLPAPQVLLSSHELLPLPCEPGRGGGWGDSITRWRGQARAGARAAMGTTLTNATRTQPLACAARLHRLSVRGYTMPSGQQGPSYKPLLAELDL